jgi:lipoprotein Spr
MKKFILILLFAFAAPLMRAQTQVPKFEKINPVTDSIVDFAKSFLGTPYKYGTCSPGSFDCSGFTSYVFAHFGYTIPRSSKEYSTLGKEIPLAECRKGDIIVFRGTHPGDKRAGHVGIVISNEGEPLQFIHASSSKNHSGVTITTYLSSAYPARFIKIVRVVN